MTALPRPSESIRAAMSSAAWSAIDHWQETGGGGIVPFPHTVAHRPESPAMRTRFAASLLAVRIGACPPAEGGRSPLPDSVDGIAEGLLAGAPR
jgi:hypothetical protein